MSTPNDPAGALAKAVREWLNDPQNRDPDAFEVWVKLKAYEEAAKAGPTKQVDWILELRDALRIYFHSRLEIDEERDPVLKIIAKHAQPNREVSARDSELLEFLERAHHLLKSTQYAGGLSYVEIGRVIEAERARAAEGKP